jgi:tRNA(Ile)-lysidine synthase TilS/MesJ
MTGKEERSEKKVLCRRCIMPATFPGIHFDAQGVCNHCRKYKGQDAQASLHRRYEEKFVELVHKHRGVGDYDVIVAYSGGKDSSYTLDIFVNRYGLRVLAMTFNNTFISPAAKDNISRFCDSLGVDHLMVAPAQALLHGIFRQAAERELFANKTLERASTICTSCISFVKGIVLRTALEKNIPFIGWGWSPGQAPVHASVMRTNPALMSEAQRAVLTPLLRVAGDGILPFFVKDDQFAGPERFPWNVHPLAFLDYDEEAILFRIGELGWQKPKDTDLNSTNCQLNALANSIHRQRYGFHPYVWEIANMVRAGCLSREEGLRKIETEENDELVAYSRAELGLD